MSKKIEFPDINTMVQYKKDGLSNEAIGKIFGCSKTTVNNYFKKYQFNYQTLEHLDTPINIERVSEYGYSDHKIGVKKNIPITEIIELHNNGYTDKEIAQQYGCSRSAITYRLNSVNINNRKSKKDNIPLRNQISESLKGKMIGQKNPNYKGNSEEKKLARGIFKSISDEMIRNSGYHCAICGKKSRIYHVHHIKPFSLIIDEFLENAYSGDINNFYNEIMQYPDFINKNNLIVICPECHKQIHYSDNPELSPYRWESPTTIESIDTDETVIEEASRVGSSDPKCRES